MACCGSPLPGGVTFEQAAAKLDGLLDVRQKPRNGACPVKGCAKKVAREYVIVVGVKLPIFRCSVGHASPVS